MHNCRMHCCTTCRCHVGHRTIESPCKGSWKYLPCIEAADTSGQGEESSGRPPDSQKDAAGEV